MYWYTSSIDSAENDFNGKFAVLSLPKDTNLLGESALKQGFLSTAALLPHTPIVEDLVAEQARLPWWPLHAGTQLKASRFAYPADVTPPEKLMYRIVQEGQSVAKW